MSEAPLQGLFTKSIMRGLIDYLNERTVEYDAGHPTITDSQWDESYFKLKELEEVTGIVFPDSPTQSITYRTVSKLNKVTHNHKMLSLAKTKEVERVSAFMGKKQTLAMAKMDGLTLTVRYIDGQFVSAETRGNGVEGEDVTHNAMVVASIPKEVPIGGEFIADGEIISTVSNFEKFSNEYKNPRNFAAGSIRLLDASECSKRGLTFVLWDVIKGLDDKPFLHEKFNFLMNVGFEVVPWTLTGSIQEQIEEITEMAKLKGYPIDGVVFKFDEVAMRSKLGATSHHFNNAIAYKFYDETYPSKLIDIEWTMGRTGVLTPVAIFEPIEMDGSTVSRASMHNLSVCEELLGAAYYGQKVEVFKANMIIPQIASAEGEKVGEEYHYIPVPRICPICGENTEIVKNDGVELLVCANPNCSGKLINRLDHFCGKKGLDIRGLSKATLDKLIDWGWVKNLLDIFELHTHKEEWIKKPGFGAKSVSNILEAIETAKIVDLDKFISSLGIPLIGSTVAKEMCKLEYDYFNIREDVEGGYDFSNWEGFGPAMSQALLTFDWTEADALNDIYLTISNPYWVSPKEKEKTKESAVNGKTVVITGKLKLFKNRAELANAIEKAGGKVTGSVTKNTDVLVNNDNESTSAKNVSAKKLGIPVVTEEEFVANYL